MRILRADTNGAPCKKCHSNQYAVAGSKECTICPPGTLGGCSGLGCETPKCKGKCPKGFHCKDGKETQCTNTDKKTDPTDTYLDTEGGTSQASCKSCKNRCANTICQDCTHTGDCQIFNDHCFVQGKCYENNANDPSSSCRSCQRDGTDIGGFKRFRMVVAKQMTCILSCSLRY